MLKSLYEGRRVIISYEVTSPPRLEDRFRKLRTGGPRRWTERHSRFPVTIERACTAAPVPLRDPA
jgi:hypothetical protein